MRARLQCGIRLRYNGCRFRRNHRRLQYEKILGAAAGACDALRAGRACGGNRRAGVRGGRAQRQFQSLLRRSGGRPAGREAGQRFAADHRPGRRYRARRHFGRDDFLRHHTLRLHISGGRGGRGQRGRQRGLHADPAGGRAFLRRHACDHRRCDLLHLRARGRGLRRPLRPRRAAHRGPCGLSRRPEAAGRAAAGGRSGERRLQPLGRGHPGGVLGRY